MRCLDLGCGSGDVAFELAARTCPGGHVTGIDQDEVKIALAREDAAEQGIVNVEFVAGSVYEWSEPAAYDLVYCRFLLQHLSRPVDLLRAMWAGVRRGGLIVAEDADFTGCFCEPPNAGYDFFASAYSGVLERHGGDPLTARMLYAQLLEAGIPNPAVSVRQGIHTSGAAKALPLSTVEATSGAIIREGIASEDELSAALAELAAHTADPATIIALPRTIQVWATAEAAAGAT